MHPIDMKQREHREPASDSRAGWWILMALVTTTILVVALVMATDPGTGPDPVDPAQTEQPAEPAS